MNRLGMLLLAMASCAAAQSEAGSVCDAIYNRTQYNGRILAVSGVVAAGGHGIYLESPTKCTQQLVTKGVVWPNIINLVYPNNQSPDPSFHAPFELDVKAVQDADKRALMMGYRAGVDVETATYIGLFVTYPDLEKRVSPGMPGSLLLGFGPTGLGAPTQLVIKTVKDVSVTRASHKHD